MQATAQHLDLAPPDGGRWRGPVGWALGVHTLLVLALTWGVGWQHDTQVVMETELWSTLPQVAAPRLVAPEPAPPQPPAPLPPPKPEVAPPPPPPGPSEAQIALQKKQEQLKLQQQKAEEETKRKAAEKLAAAKELERQKREAALAKAKEQEQAQKKKAQEQAQRDKQENARQQAQLEAERRKNLERMMGQAGATGASNATGNAQRSSGPSATYAGKLVGRIKPNIVFPDTVPGNPRAEVEVRTLPDGSIVGRKLLKSSGHAAWDDAVLRAVDRTNTLPKDEDGRVPAVIILGFRPLD